MILLLVINEILDIRQVHDRISMGKTFGEKSKLNNSSYYGGRYCIQRKGKKP